MDPPRRKYVPSETYRLMLLAALRHRRGEPVSKGTLAAETRSSHYAITKALTALEEERFVVLEGSATIGYTIRLTDAGRHYCERHHAYIVEALKRESDQQFRYGRRPPWLESALADAHSSNPPTRT